MKYPADIEADAALAAGKGTRLGLEAGLDLYRQAAAAWRLEAVCGVTNGWANCARCWGRVGELAHLLHRLAEDVSRGRARR